MFAVLSKTDFCLWVTLRTLSAISAFDFVKYGILALLFPYCFLPFWRTFCHFYQTQTCTFYAPCNSNMAWGGWGVGVVVVVGCWAYNFCPVCPLICLFVSLSTKTLTLAITFEWY